MTPARSGIVHLVTSLNFGGVERHMQIVAEHAEDKSLLSFVAIGKGGAAEKAIRDFGCETVCLGQKTSVYSVATFWAVYRLLQTLKPAVLHTHGAEANFHGIVAAYLAGVPVRIGEEIGVPDHSWTGRLVFRLVYRLAGRVIAVSPVVSEYLEGTREVSRKKLAVIEYPIRIPRVEVADRGGRERLRCCYVGRLVDWKNVSATIQALVELRRRGRSFDFWIIGEGPERAALDSKVKDEGIDDCVRFLGFQERPEDFVAQCDVFVLTSSEKEGFCLALVEAMAMGIPAVATRVGIVPEVIEHGVSGWIVTPGDMPGLADALDRVLDLPRDRLRAVGAEGRVRVLERSSPQNYAANLRSLYGSVLAGDQL